MIFTFSNFLTCMRGPLALFFLTDSPFYRVLAIFLAMITDSLDGYLARRSKTTSQLGAFLDPLMDKFFVCFVLTIFLIENRLQPWQALALLSRDVALFIFGMVLMATHSLSKIRFQSIWCGKVTTAFQFLLFIALTLQVFVPYYLYFVFIGLGVLSLIELLFIDFGINLQKE